MAELDALFVEVYVGGAWVDLSADVAQQPELAVKYGIFGNGPDDRVAGTGTMVFELFNDDGKYTPGGSSVLTGFDNGIKCRLRLVYNSNTYYKFYGRIAPFGIKLDTGTIGDRRTTVMAVDYMDMAARQRLKLTEYVIDKRIDEVVELITGYMPIAPLTTDYETDGDIFKAVFDTVDNKTTAMAEFAKLAKSEQGYIFVRRNTTNGETLRVETRNTRGVADYAYVTDVGTYNSVYPLLVEMMDETSVNLLDETGAILYMENNRTCYEATDSYIKTMTTIGGVDLTATIPADSISVSRGQYLFNQVNYSVFPRQVDVSAVVLFSLNSYIKLIAGEEKVVRCQYRDPNGANTRVAGKDMVEPVATTDYLMYANSNGTGTNMTASLSVTAEFGSEAVNYTVKNNAATTGYVTKLQARGYGIYLYDPITRYVEDSTSIAINGMSEYDSELIYQDDIDVCYPLALKHLSLYKDPFTTVDTVEFSPNLSALAMQVLLDCEPGDRIGIYDSQTGIDDDYFIQSVELYLKGAQIMRCNWKLISASVAGAFGVYWTVGYSHLGVDTNLGI